MSPDFNYLLKENCPTFFLLVLGWVQYLVIASSPYQMIAEHNLLILLSGSLSSAYQPSLSLPLHTPRLCSFHPTLAFPKISCFDYTDELDLA